MKRFVVVLALAIIFGNALALEWQGENQFDIIADAFGAENAIAAVDDTVYAVYVTRSNDTMTFVKSCHGNISQLSLGSFETIPANSKPSIMVDLPNISIMAQMDDETVLWTSSDYGNSWDRTSLTGNIMDSNDPQPIITTRDGIHRSFTVNSRPSDQDVSNYSSQSLSPNGSNVYYSGIHQVHGITIVNGDLFIKNVGGLPVFHDPVIISGKVISGFDYPVDEVFLGGLTEQANVNDLKIKPALFKEDYRDNADTQYIVDGDCILMLDVNGNNASGFIGRLSEPVDSWADVWDVYPPIFDPQADSLFLNSFATRDTIWTEVSFTLSEKFYTNATLWIKGTFSGNKSFYSSGDIYLIGDILLSNTIPGEDTSTNASDKVTLISDKSIQLKYGYKHPETNVRIHPNCQADETPILIYADLIALNNDYQIGEDPDFEAGFFSFEYQHPHPSTPSVNVTHEGDEYYYDWIDLHRFKYPHSQFQPWPPQIDYPWYNPLWPETHPYLERGTVHLYGALYQNRRGYIHRSGNDSAYPSNDGYWDIPMDMCGGPVTPSVPYNDPVIPDLTLQAINYPGTTGSGVGYDIQHFADERSFPFSPRRDIWSPGALISDGDANEVDILKWHRAYETVRNKSIDYHDGSWLYHLNNTFMTEDAAYPQNPGEDWEIVQAKLLDNSDVLSLQKSSLAETPGYRLVISDIDGEQANTVFEIPQSHDFVSLSRIMDGFLLVTPAVENNSARIHRLDLNGQFSDTTYEMALPEGFYGEDVSESRITFSNPTANILHACLWYRTGDMGGIIIHKYGNIAPISSDDPLQVPVVISLKCYPNPFSTAINLNLETDKQIDGMLSIYNIRGQKVRDLPLPNAKGNINISWDGSDHNGKQVAQGVYFVKIRSEAETKVTRILKLK